jgi:hypothetical protein
MRRLPKDVPAQGHILGLRPLIQIKNTAIRAFGALFVPFKGVIGTNLSDHGRLPLTLCRRFFMLFPAYGGAR